MFDMNKVICLLITLFNEWGFIQKESAVELNNELNYLYKVIAI